MSCTSQQNGVSERCNRTLMDMVRNMLINSTLPISLWMYACKLEVVGGGRVGEGGILGARGGVLKKKHG